MNIISPISNPYGIARGGFFKNSPMGSGSAVGLGQPDTVKSQVKSQINSIDRSAEVGRPLKEAQGEEASPEKTGQKELQSRETGTAGTAGTDAGQLTQDEIRLVEKLKQIDTEVRNHEMAHIAAGGSYITSGASYTYQKGPDGKRYAVGGEVSISTSPVPGNPEATLKKMNQVRRAALAPGDPSSQDIKVAANAASQALKATSELTMVRSEQAAEANKNRALGASKKDAADAYTRVGELPESETSSFQIAV